VGALLVDGWLAGCVETIRVVDEASVSLVREAVRRHGAAQGLATEASEALAAAASEVAHNQRKHARGGSVGVRDVTRTGVPGVEVVAADQGPGLADPAAVFRDAPRTTGSGLGVGLAAAYRLAGELDIDVRRGEGTCVWLRRFAEAVPRQEIAILARPCRGETVLGDHAAFRRDDEALELAVVDGLGHGPLARDAADVAIATWRAHAGDAPLELVAACDRDLETTRGAVMSVARFDARTRLLEHAGAGNISTRIHRPGASRAFIGTARVLGARQRSVRIASESASLGSDSLVLLFTDGLTTRTDLNGQQELMRQPPLVVASELLARFGREDDDALVLVARLR
jgi:anti-sigma regulatory factor (Ser/Thr protein kinase)